MRDYPLIAAGLLSAAITAPDADHESRNGIHATIQLSGSTAKTNLKGSPIDK